MKKCVCFTGYRPFKLPFPSVKGNAQYTKLCSAAKELVAKFIKLGYDYFICGMAQGGDLILGSAVCQLKGEHKDIVLECALPYRGQALSFDGESRAMHEKILSCADKITVISEAYSPDCFMRRNRYMIDSSSALIAIYDGKKGGTHNTVEYARKKGLPITIISPFCEESTIEGKSVQTDMFGAGE